MSRDAVLPRFNRPPVSEVVFSVQFEQIVGLTTAHLGVWWETADNRLRYPICEERPPIHPAVETFEPSPQRFNFEVTAGPPTPALWFLSKDRRELLQLQRDRFTRNWTKASADAAYPSYEKLRPRFRADLEAFETFVKDQGLGQVYLTQCELSYIDPIAPGGVWQRHGQLDRVLAPWSGRYTEGFLTEPEDVSMSLRYRIPGGDGEPLGRLLTDIRPVYSAEQQPVYIMTLTARGRPVGTGVEGALTFLDIGHEWIVKGFSTLTTQPMHKEWRRVR